MHPSDRLAELERLAELGGGEDGLRRQHEAGKLTARERVDLLFDPGTFEELDKLVTHRCRDFGMADEIVPATASSPATAESKGSAPRTAFAQDFTVFGGSLSGDERRENRQGDGPRDARWARRSSGSTTRSAPRIQGSVALARAATPIITAQHAGVPGCSVARRFPRSWARDAGGAVYSPAITDFNIMVEGTSYMFVTGPGNVIKTVTHEEVTKEDLGGAMAHNATSGVAPLRRA
jgi:propionyl-CoA carboxylase beta chain